MQILFNSEQQKTKEGNTALALIMHSEATHIDQIHVIDSKQTLKNLRNTIDKILYETAPEVV